MSAVVARCFPECKACTECGTVLHLSYFSPRKNRNCGYASCCKACMRERWRRWQSKAKGRPHLRPIQDSPERVAEAIVQAAACLAPGALGLRVYRLINGRYFFRPDNRLPPMGSELIGVYDFEATAADITEDILA